MADLNKIKKESEFTYELYGPAELVDTEEINAIHPDDKEEVFIQFRRLTLTEMAEAAGNDLDDLSLAKKIVKGWGGYTQDGKPAKYKPNLLDLLPYQDVDWILKEAYAATTMQATDLPAVTFNLRQMTQTQRKALQQKSLKGFRNKKASQRMQTLLLQRTIIGWEGVYYKGKEVAYSPDLVNLLPWSVVAEILDARPEAEDPGAIEAAGKN
jgi:hypothetical protein